MRWPPGILLCWSLVASAFAQTVYNDAPEWTSSDTQRSTGAALADIDRDGWVDLVVSNGNDMQQQHLVVYYNQGDGSLPLTPDWESQDIAFNGHLDVADVNGDGWLDVAVAELGNGDILGPAAKLYLNNNGTLSANPDWISPEIAPAFGCGFGDVNNDGRPDLAVATGWAYGTPHLYHNYVYLNVGGQLDASASWISDDTWDYQGVLWVDADDDGWLDLVGVPARTNTQIYRNLGGALETTASWSTTNSDGQDAIMASAGDVTGDGWRDLFVTNNRQLGGNGQVRQYTGFAEGFYTQTPTWSFNQNYGSAVALADLNDDGLLDLMIGAWWNSTRLFLNNGAGFDPTATWTSGNTSVIERIVFADIDRDDIRPALDSFAADGRRLVYLSGQPIQEITAVVRDGVHLDPDQYTFSRELGWVTVDAAPMVELAVQYTYSGRLDMAVTNWNGGKGNYVYYNQLGCRGDLTGDGQVNICDLGELLAQYGCTTGCTADLDGDDDADIQDLLIVLEHYGCMPG